jgi:hypothetical protein
VRDAHGLHIANGLGYSMLVLVLAFTGLYFFMRAAYMGTTVLRGYPRPARRRAGDQAGQDRGGAERGPARR